MRNENIEKKTNLNILLVGGYPPPIGGITVHIQRLQKYCLDNLIKCYILDTTKFYRKNKKKSNLIYFLQLNKLLKIWRISDIVHFHVATFRNLLKLYILFLYFRKKKKIVTIHSGNFKRKFNKMNGMQKYLVKYLLNQTERIITVSKEQKEVIYEFGQKIFSRIIVVPAYLFPIATKVGLNLQDISKILQNNRTKLLTSGYLQHYYGYEMILDFLSSNQNYFGVFVFYGKSDPKYRKKIVSQIDKRENALFFENLTPESFNWLLKNVEIYVRNTDRDGDCVALREAAYWGIKTLASNAVRRPEGVKLFKYNNYDDFGKKMNDVMNESAVKGFVDKTNNAEKILSVYYDLLQEE